MSEKTIVIPNIKLQTIMVSIVGVTALLTNRFSPEALAKIEDKQQHKAKMAKEARDPDADFKAAMHVIAPGVYGFPAVGIRKALVAAGGRFAGEKMTELRGIINIDADLVPIIAPAPRMRSDPIKLRGMTGSIAYRPEFSPWSMDVPVTFNSAIIGEAQILNLFQICGFSIGIGAWRPECNGTFGRFQLNELGAASAA